MYVLIIYLLEDVTVFFMDEALPSIQPSVRGQLVITLLTLEPHGIFGIKFAYLIITYTFKHCPATGMQIGTRLCRASVRLSGQSISKTFQFLRKIKRTKCCLENGSIHTSNFKFSENFH